MLERTMTIAIGLVMAGAVAGASVPENSPWGGDVNPGAGVKLVESVRRELRTLILAPEKERAAKAKALAAKRAVQAIEAWKRFRDPKLVELARACLAHPDWHVVHRGLHWARALGDVHLLAEAWPLLEHQEPRIREKATLTALECWSDEAAAALFGAGESRAHEAVVRRLVAEKDSCVRQVLRALERRIEGRLEPRTVMKEPIVKDGMGLLWSPFIRGLKHLDEVAPGVEIEPVSFFAHPPAEEPSLATLWSAPLLGYGKEEVPGIQLQPFGNLRKDETIVHTGQDVGGCLDGAGLYALADGVVRLIDAGSDCGTRIVIEHRRAGDERVTAVFMHAGGTIFIKAGEQVTRGQLLGTIGLSFSIENGGQFAHLHLGLYPGPFRADHNHGYQSASEGLSDWLDPAQCLAAWMAASPPQGPAGPSK